MVSISANGTMEPVQIPNSGSGSSSGTTRRSPRRPSSFTRAAAAAAASITRRMTRKNSKMSMKSHGSDLSATAESMKGTASATNVTGDGTVSNGEAGHENSENKPGHKRKNSNGISMVQRQLKSNLNNMIKNRLGGSSNNSSSSNSNNNNSDETNEPLDMMPPPPPPLAVPAADESIDKSRIRAAAAAAAASRSRRLSQDKARLKEFEAAINLSSPGPRNVVSESKNDDEHSSNGSMSNDELFNDLGKGLKVSLEFLNASDKDIRKRSGECIASLIKDLANDHIHTDLEDIGNMRTNNMLDLTKDEMNALTVLATSKIASLRSVAGGVLKDFAPRNGFPRGNLGLGVLLNHATKLVQSDECALQIFAIRMASDLAAKGTIWQERLLERNWLAKIIDIITRMGQGSVVPTLQHRQHTDDTLSPSSSSGEEDASSHDDGEFVDDNDSSKETTTNGGKIPEQALILSEEHKRLLKLAFEFIATLNLDEAEQTLRRKKKLKLMEQLGQERLQLIDLLSSLSARCTLQMHTSLLKLLFGALTGLIKNLTKEQWKRGLATKFISNTLDVVLSKAAQAATQYQSFAAAILSQSMMQQGNDDDDQDDFVDDGTPWEEMGHFDGGVTPATPPPTFPSSPMPSIEPLGVDSLNLNHHPSPAAYIRQKRPSNLSVSTFTASQRQQIYRQNSQMTASNCSANSYTRATSSSNLNPFLIGTNSMNHHKTSNKTLPVVGGSSLLLYAEQAANESRWAISQRNAQQSNQLLIKKLHLVSLTMEALQVVRCACVHSMEIANAAAEAFEVHNVMRVLNMLYRAEVPGAKTEVAQFLYAVCKNISDQHKILLCESGVIVRLIRLASPSSVYGKKTAGNLTTSDESAFIPAISALAEMASVDVIGARIIIAGGLGPLYSHANSTRQTRPAAREALDVLGVSNINDLVDLWTLHRKETKEAKMDDQDDEDDDEENEDGADHHELPKPQPLSPTSSILRAVTGGVGGAVSRRSHGPNSSGSSNGSSGSSRTAKLLGMRHHSVGNSTKSFFDAKPAMLRLPRAKRVYRLISKWHRDDGQSLVMNPDYLRADPTGSRPWDKSTVLGSGAFSTVYRAYLRKDKLSQEDPENGGDSDSTVSSTSATSRYVPVAVKKLTEAAFGDDSFLEEIKILSKVPAHRNITNLHGVVFTEKTVLIVSELGGPHTLAWHLATYQDSNKQNVSPLCTSWVAKLKVLIGIGEAIKALQSMNPAILHLDLKSSNVLISDLGNGRFVPKLCDFGLAVELKAGYEFLSPANHGTLQWMAPEVMRNEDVELSKGFDQSADTFSFAIILWEVAHPGRVPWDELAVDVNLDSIQERIREFVCSGRRLTCFDTDGWPNGYERLMRSCWRHNPADRPSFVRSFLTDPDSFSWTGLKSKQQKEASQETIGTTLKRMLWEVKSAKRVSSGEMVSKSSFRRAKRHLHQHSSSRRNRTDTVPLKTKDDENQHSDDEVLKLPQSNIGDLTRQRSTQKLRRQSSVIGHRCINPNLEYSLDYHDHDIHDDEEEDKIADTVALEPTKAMQDKDYVARATRFKRHISNSVDESSLPSHHSLSFLQ